MKPRTALHQPSVRDSVADVSTTPAYGDTTRFEGTMRDRGEAGSQGGEGRRVLERHVLC